MKDTKTPALEPLIETPAPLQAVPTFEAAAKREKTIALEWPFTLDGKRFDQVVIRRMTQGEVAGMIQAINEAQSAGTSEIGFPIFYDTEGFLLSDAIMAAMDADDAATLDEAARDFLPRRFRSVTE